MLSLSDEHVRSRPGDERAFRRIGRRWEGCLEEVTGCPGGDRREGGVGGESRGEAREPPPHTRGRHSLKFGREIDNLFFSSNLRASFRLIFASSILPHLQILASRSKFSRLNRKMLFRLKECEGKRRRFHPEGEREGGVGSSFPPKKKNLFVIGAKARSHFPPPSRARRPRSFEKKKNLSSFLLRRRRIRKSPLTPSHLKDNAFPPGHRLR